MEEEIKDVVRAKRFELVNDEGQKRAQLFSRGDGAVALSLFENDGDTLRATLGVTSNGTAILNLYDRQDNLRATVQVDPTKPEAQFSLADELGRARLQAGLHEDGTAGIVMFDRWGHRRAALNVADDGDPVLGFLDADGKATGGFVNGQFSGRRPAQ